MKTKIIFLLLGLSVGLLSYQQLINQAYFYQLRPTKDVQIVGSYPANKTECSKMACYHFKYDWLMRPVKVTHLKNLVPAIDRTVGVSVITQQYNKQGFTRRFYNTHNKPMADYDGVYGENLVYAPEQNGFFKLHVDKNENLMANNRGVYGYVEVIKNRLKVKSVSLNKNLEPTVDINGIVYKTFKRNNNGFVIETGNYNVDNNLTNSAKDGVAVTKKNVNQFGDVTRVAFYDKELKPVKRLTDGVSVLEWRYDEQGNEIDEDGLR